MEDVEIEDIGSIESRTNLQAEETGEEVSSASHLGEGILVKNSRSKVT